MRYDMIYDAMVVVLSKPLITDETTRVWNRLLEAGSISHSLAWTGAFRLLSALFQDFDSPISLILF